MNQPTTAPPASSEEPSPDELAAAYLRISDDREGLELGVTRQEDDVVELTKRLGKRVYKIYKDNDIGASTRTNTPRPGYDELLADAQAGLFKTIVAYTTGRLTRRPLEHEGQIQLAELHSVEYRYVKSPSFDLNTASGRMIARFLAAQDAAEAEIISERVARAYLQRRMAGGFGGGPRPYGFLADGITVDPEEARWIEFMADEVLAGVPLRQTAAWLNAAGVPTAGRGGRPRRNQDSLLSKTGERKWGSPTIRDILLRPRTAGLIDHKGVIVAKAKWEPIVDEQTWRTIVAILTDPMWMRGDKEVARTHTKGVANRYLGTGNFECMCGLKVLVRRGNSQAAAYACYTREAPGDHVKRNAANLDAFVRETIVERMKQDDAVDLLPSRQPGEDPSKLLKEVNDLRDRMAVLARVFSSTGDEQYLVDGKREIQAEIDAKLARLSRTAGSAPYMSMIDSDDPGAEWDRMSLGRKRAITIELMKVRILPTTRGRGFNPDDIDITWKR